MPYLTRYTYGMNTKSVIVTLIIILVVAVGGYFAYTSFISNPAQNGDTQNTAADQVEAQEVTVGTGAEAVPGSKVSVLYIGQLPDGTVFDSSAAHGNQPLVFTLGEPGLIPGFQIGVNGMKVGGERLIAIPASLGYGDQAVRQNPQDPTSAIIIPANSKIVFRLQLVKVEPATTTAAQ